MYRLAIIGFAFSVCQVCPFRTHLEEIVGELQDLEDEDETSNRMLNKTSANCQQLTWTGPEYKTDFSGNQSGGGEDPLPLLKTVMNCKGVFWAALALSTGHTPMIRPKLGTNKGHEDKVRDRISENYEAAVEYPYALKFSKTTHFKLWETPTHGNGVFGKKKGVAVVWKYKNKDDEPWKESDIETIYVGFQAARKAQLHEILRILSPRTYLLEYSWPETGNSEPIKINLHRHAGWKAEKLWVHYGLGEALHALAAEPGKKQFIFCGLSHGAALAQILGLRFELEHRERLKKSSSELVGEVTSYIFSWNAYRWTDENGMELAKRTNVNRGIHFIKGYYDKEKCEIIDTDGVPGFFPSSIFAHYPYRALLGEAGELMKCELGCPLQRSKFNPFALARVMEHHQAFLTQPAMAMQMLRCPEGLKQVMCEGLKLSEKICKALLSHTANKRESLILGEGENIFCDGGEKGEPASPCEN